MERRELLRSALMSAGAVLTASEAAAQAAPASGTQQFYQMRTYALRNGPQPALCQGYFERALIPALGRLGMGPVGRSSWMSAPRRRPTMC